MRVSHWLAIPMVCSLFMPMMSFAQDAKSAPPLSKQDVEKIVQEYLIKNPQVIQQSLAIMQQRQAEERRKQQATALTGQKETLYNSSRSVVVGNPKGDVTIVEFYDYNCGYCKSAVRDLQALIASDPKVRVVLKDFPILSQASAEAARVAVAAKKQLSPQQYWTFHVALMSQSERANEATALLHAERMGVNMAKLKEDMNALDVPATLQETADLAKVLGVRGTPNYVIGDEIIPGAPGLEGLKELVSNVRKCGKGRCG